MKNRSKILYFLISLIILVTMATGISLAGKTVTIVGFVNEEYQIVDEEGTVYEIADSDKGEEVAELTGRKLKVTGNMLDADGTPIIDITRYELLDD
jgi:hypothetical protein